MSISPGSTRRPDASSTRSARAAGMSASSASILPKRMPMSRLPRRFWLGSRSSPPFTTRSNLSSGPMAARAAVLKSPPANSAPMPATKRRRSLRLMVSSPGKMADEESARRASASIGVKLTRAKDSGRGLAVIVSHRAVAPGGLRRVERAVGARDPRAVVVILGRERRVADARGDAHARGAFELRQRDLLADALGDRGCAGGVGARQHHAELLAAVAPGEIVQPERIAQDRRHRA